MRIGLGLALGLGGALPWDPLRLYSGRSPQYYDHAASRVTKDASNLVSQSNDRGPLARHLKQAGASAVKPTWVASSQDMNGQPALSFTDSTLDANPQWLDTDVHASEAQPETITFVAMGDTSGSTAYTFDNASATLCSLASSGGSTFLQCGSFYDTTYTAPGTINWPETHVYTAVINGASSRFWVDGVATAVAGAAGSNARTALRIGARGGASGIQGFRGLIGPILRVRGASSDAEIVRDHAALAAKCIPEFWLLDGDSRTRDQGDHVPVGSAWPSYMRTNNLLGRAVRIINLASNGAGASTVAARVPANTIYGSLRLRPAKRFVQWIDINDIIVPPGTVTAANEFTALMANAASYAAAGLKSEICTGCNYTGDDNQAALNALLLAQTTYGVRRLDGSPAVTLLDGQHPDVAGNIVLAQRAAQPPTR